VRFSPPITLTREWLALLGFLAAVLLVLQRGGGTERADLWAYDLAATARIHPDAAPTDGAPVIVAIDEESLARQGRWPWSRTLLSQILDRLAAAQAGPVLLDIILAESEDAAADAALAAALKRYPAGVVLPVYADDADGMTPVLPLPAFAAVARTGHVHARLDSDGIVRRIHPRESLGGEVLPHVAWLLAGIAPAPDATAVLPAFSGVPGTMRRIPAADLLDGRLPMASLRGRTVLVGATAAGLGDAIATPVAGSGGLMPGVEFVGNAVTSIRAGTLAVPLGGIQSSAISLALLLLLLASYRLAPPRVALATTIAVAAAAGLGAAAGLLLFNRWWPPVGLMVVAALAYPLWSWRRLEASVAAMEREAGRIARLAPLAPAEPERPAALLDPVESRIAAITRAVDRISAAIAVDDPGAARQRKNDMLRQLAHDLRAPLISLRGLAEEFGDADDPRVARVDRCARRALDLSEQFLLFSRAENVTTSDFREIDLVDLLHRVADDLWEDARLAGKSIERRCAPESAWVEGDARLLQRALANLAWNALRYGPSGAPVTLFLDRESDGALRLGAADPGDGFDPNDPPSIARSSHRDGHGLGLAFVRKVAAKHSVELATERDGGFLVFLRWPGV
jgi:CHASE2 domain-containing sensor protein